MISEVRYLVTRTVITERLEALSKGSWWLTLRDQGKYTDTTLAKLVYISMVS